jgi:hypothetical protein
MFDDHHNYLDLHIAVPAQTGNEMGGDEINWDEVHFDFWGFMADNWIYYVLIFVFLVYIYNKVFRVRKLPLLKDLVIYALIALGAFVLLIFQVDANLPIVYSLAVAVGLMLTVRIRYFFLDRAKQKEESKDSSDDAM